MTAAGSPLQHPAAPASLLEALGARRPGHALPAAFALDPAIYAHELRSIWSSSWLCAGSSAQAQAPGEFFCFEVDRYSLILVRDGEGTLHALHNTCRHRGMPLCGVPSGRVKRWVCPYHQWSYDLDGRLLSSGGMKAELDGEDHSLGKAVVAEVAGLVFVWLGQQPEPIERARRELETALRPQGLDRAKVAHQQEYHVQANWKLVWENNRECWHCHGGHPEYIKANFDTAHDDKRTRAMIEARVEDHRRALGVSGAVEHGAPGLFAFPSPGRWWAANRTPLARGFVTESLDGAPVGPLMGDYANHDVGTLRVRALPNMWCHASADHAVLTWFTPDGPGATRIRVQWLVARDAVEGRDYTLERLLPFWRLTSEQDWELCERNHAGVANPAFVPGPYSTTREYNVMAFVEWYVERVGRS